MTKPKELLWPSYPVIPYLPIFAKSYHLGIATFLLNILSFCLSVRLPVAVRPYQCAVIFCLTILSVGPTVLLSILLYVSVCLSSFYSHRLRSLIDMKFQ